MEKARRKINIGPVKSVFADDPLMAVSNLYRVLFDFFIFSFLLLFVSAELFVHRQRWWRRWRGGVGGGWQVGGWVGGWCFQGLEKKNVC